MGRWIAIVVFLVGVAARAELRRGDQVTIAAGEVVPEDLYVVAGTLNMEGRVHGDLVAVAGRVNLTGQVDGDALIAAGNSHIAANIGQSLRFVSGEADVHGNIGQDVAVAAGRLVVGSDANVGRDVLLTSGNATVDGQVQGEVLASAGRLTLGGTFAGPVDVAAGQLEIRSGARIPARLHYASSEEANIAPGAQLGQVERTEVRTGPTALLWVLGWLRAIVGFTLLGLLVALISPRFARTVPETLRQAPLPSLGVGAALVIAIPALALFLFIVGILLGGWWIGLLLLAAFFAALAFTVPAVGAFIGRWVLARGHARSARFWVSLVMGVALVTLALRIPVLGVAVALAVAFFGLGALVLSGWRLRSTTAPIAQPG